MLSGIFSAALALSTAQVTAQSVQPAPAQTPAPAPEQSAPRFRSSVDLVSVAAVVRDRKGRFVKDLDKKDFEIVESGERRPIIDFHAESDGPVKVAVLLDISGSMRVGQRTEDARQAANHIFSTLTGDDRAAVFTFDTGLDYAQPFTADRGKLDAAVRAAGKPFGQTSLYDAIARTSREVADATTTGKAKLPQRSAVVVITDGVDTHSRMSPSDVARAASEIDVPVYIVAVMATVDDPREASHERNEGIASDLQELAQRTGGELFIASAPAHASMAARQLVSELRHQYVLAFEASNRAGWRPMEVRTRHNDLVVRARTGYSGAAQSSSVSFEDAADNAAMSRTSRRPVQSGR